jgi:hypothetical protein
MSNIFDQAATSATAVEEKLLGPTYNYAKNINSPQQLGMSERGSMQQLGKNIMGLVAYVELLVEGGGDASKTGRPLGNKFFLQTGGKCLDINSKQDAERFIYINNVADGSIPLISDAAGVQFSEFRGLIPGVLSDAGVLNPFAILGSFMAGSKPECQEISMEVLDNNNVSDTQTHHVALADISNITPCSFREGKNPVTGIPCSMAFQNMKNEPQSYGELSMPEDPFVQLYFACLSILGIYVLYRIIEKKRGN